MPGPSGVALLAASSGDHRLARPDRDRGDRLLGALAGLAGGHDVLLADTAAGIGPDVLDFALRAERVIVVTTPEPAALADAYGLFKALDALSRERALEVPTPHVFVNAARDVLEARGTAERLRSTCERFLLRSPRMMGWMPSSGAVRRAAAGRRPFVLSEPRSLGARGLARTARDLARALKANDGRGR